MARDYAKEYRDYHSKPSQVKRRAKRNAARRLLVKEGRVSKGDGKDVDHKDRNPSNNAPSNLRVTSKKANRSRNSEFNTIMNAQPRQILEAIISFGEEKKWPTLREEAAADQYKTSIIGGGVGGALAGRALHSKGGLPGLVAGAALDTYAVGGLLRRLSAREALDSIITFADPRPRNSLGMFSGADGSGIDPEAIGAVYKQGAQVAQQEESVLSKIGRKLKGKKIRMSARERLDSIINFSWLNDVAKKIEDAAPGIKKKYDKFTAIQERFVTGQSAFPRTSREKAKELFREVAGGKLPENFTVTARKGGSHFNPGTSAGGSSVQTGPVAEIIAHEAGHARQARIAKVLAYKAAKKAGIPSREAIEVAKNAPAAVFAGTNFAKQIPTKTKTGAVLASLPNLAIEADASRRAVKHLGKDAIPALARAWSTYGAGAANKIRKAGKVEMSARDAMGEIIELGITDKAKKAYRGFWHGESATIPSWADAAIEAASVHPLAKIAGVDANKLRAKATKIAQDQAAGFNRKLLGWSVVPPAIQYGISKHDSNKSERNIIKEIKRRPVQMSARESLDTIKFGIRDKASAFFGKLKPKVPALGAQAPGVLSRGYKAAESGGPRFKSSVSMPTATRPINPAAREMPAREYTGQPAAAPKATPAPVVSGNSNVATQAQDQVEQPTAMSGPSLKYRLRGWRGAAVAGATGVGVGYAMTPSGGQRQLSAREELNTIAFGRRPSVQDIPDYLLPGADDSARPEWAISERGGSQSITARVYKPETPKVGWFGRKFKDRDHKARWAAWEQAMADRHRRGQLASTSELSARGALNTILFARGGSV